MHNDTRVTACIPHFRCQRYLRRAVQSLLDQSHRNMEVFVVNDGDPQPPWDVLADIRDPRLIRFDLQSNRGPYFATQVVLSATSTPYFLIQDADDWSSPRRVERLLDALQRDRSDLAVSAEPQFLEHPSGSLVVDVRWRKDSRKPDDGNFIVHHRLTPSYKYRAPHHGLFRTGSLRAIGGYYCGLRISYDTLLPNLILMMGRISHVPDPLYFRQLRPESLTHGSSTGIGSANATRESAIQRHLYRSCFYYYQFFKAGRLTLSQLTACIRAVCAANITPAEHRDLIVERNRLSALLLQHHASGRAGKRIAL
jgi:glycosyltransferase involved in cell wall biosynthesis